MAPEKTPPLGNGTHPSKAGGSPVRIALLGCGAVSELYYAPALQHLEEQGLIVLSAVYDPNKERAAQLCAQFPKAVAHQDENFLQTTPLDLAIVASPVNAHESQAVRAFEAGISVLCEKPLAADTAAAERIISAARKHKRLLAVGLLRRFYSNVQFTRELIQNKTLGAVKSFSIQEGGTFNWPARSDSFFKKGTAGGGILLDIGVHVLDLIVHWFGEPKKLTYADDAMGGLDANCRMELVYEEGFKGTIHLSRDWRTTNLYVIEFERGTLKMRAGEAEHVELEMNGSSFSVRGSLKEHAHSASSASVAFSVTTFQQAFLAQLQDLILALQSGSLPKVTGEEGIRSLRLIEYCYQNRTLMDMPWLTPEERKAGQFLAFGGLK
jgi:predicted dehydrogenase